MLVIIAPERLLGYFATELPAVEFVQSVSFNMVKPVITLGRRPTVRLLPTSKSGR